MSSGRFARCGDCGKQKMLYPENDYKCASCTEPSSSVPAGTRKKLVGSVGIGSLEPIFITGQMNNGLTNLAFVFGEVWRDEGRSVASNVSSCDDTVFVNSLSTVLRWARRTPGKKLAIIDEADVHLAQAGRVRRSQIEDLVADLADEGVKAVFVMNCLPEFAKTKGVIRYKMQSRTETTFNDGFTSATISNIPLTSFDYDVHDMASWTR